jgi:hypothetical protein
MPQIPGTVSCDCDVLEGAGMNEIITTEQFQGTPVRVIKTDIGNVIPVGDIAAALKCSRRNVTMLINGNPHLFQEGWKTTVPLSTDGGIQNTVCLTRDAVIGVLFKMHPKRSNSEEGKRNIENFQIFVRDTISKVMDGKSVSTSTIPLQDQIAKLNYHLTIAKAIFNNIGGNLKDLQKLAMEKAGLAEWISITFPVTPKPEPSQLTEKQEPTRLLLVHGERGWLIPELIGKRLNGKSSEEVNRLLEAFGYQEKQFVDGFDKSYIWRLTVQGKGFGEEYPSETFAKHKEPRIRWSETIVKELERKLAPTVDIKSIPNLTDEQRRTQMHEAKKIRDY